MKNGWIIERIRTEDPESGCKAEQKTIRLHSSEKFYGVFLVVFFLFSYNVINVCILKIN